MATINPHTTRATGTILTAAIYNGDHVNHINNANALNVAKLEVPFSGSGLDNGTVTNAKLADMPANTIKARTNAGTGPPIDADVSALTTAVPVAGDFAVYFTAAGILRKGDVAAFGGGAPSMPRRTLTGAGTIVAGDKAGIVEITAGGNFTLGFTAAATLAANFWCIIANHSTGDIALDPNGAELIDGLSTWTLYPGGAIILHCNGTTFESGLIAAMRKQFDSSGTFIKPGAGTMLRVIGHAGGGGGGRSAAGGVAGGGGGGHCKEIIMLLSLLGTTESVTIGAGGIAGASNGNAGAAGGNTTLGSLFTVFAGGGGGQASSGGNAPGGQGGMGDRAGLTATDPSGITSHYILTSIYRVANDTVGGNGAIASQVCGGVDLAAASAVNGGSGGGGKDNAAVMAAGTSLGIGGSGGASGVAGSVPGGGGGGNVNATAGAGGAGRLIIEIR